MWFHFLIIVSFLKATAREGGNVPLCLSRTNVSETNDSEFVDVTDAGTFRDEQTLGAIRS
jgi:hypothetical protein